MTQNSKTLTDHIYVSESRNALETCVPISNICDHHPVYLALVKKIKYSLYTYFSNPNEHFLNDLFLSPLAMVYNITELAEALDFGLGTFNTIYDKHDVYKQKGKVCS